MRRIASWIIFAILLSSLPSFQGCATHSISAQDLRSVERLTVIRRETPALKVRDDKVRLLAEILYAPVAALLSDTPEDVPEHAIDSEDDVDPMVLSIEGMWLREYQEQATAAIPDFGELVMTKFITRIAEEMPNQWPAIVVAEQAVKGYTHESGTIMEFEVVEIELSNEGLTCESIGQIKSVESGQTRWRKVFTYKSKAFDRKKSRSEYKADDFRLLKEEVDFAAEATVSDFIKHIKEGIQSSKD